jgi:hypothetical protein
VFLAQVGDTAASGFEDPVRPQFGNQSRSPDEAEYSMQTRCIAVDRIVEARSER